MACLQVLVVLCCLARIVYSAEYYVKPDNSSTTCPSQPCLTLSEYLQDPTTYFTSGSTFTLLQGQHLLSQTMALSNVTGFTLRGAATDETVIIAIIAGGSMTFDNSQELKIENLGILYKGRTLTSHTALTVEDCTLNISDVQFTGESDTTIFSQGIRLSRATANFTDCSFRNWHSVNGGAVFTNESNVTFSGRTMFANNTAEVSGGGIHISNNSKVSFIGVSIFTENKARTVFVNFNTGGAGLYSLRSNVQFEGTTIFNRNGPIDENTYLAGGGVKLHLSTLRILDRAVFISNSGGYAGALQGADSEITLEGRLNFTLNRFGGTISLFRSNFTCSGAATFSKNEITTPEGFGPAIFAENSTLMFSGNISFINNIAHNGVGGALFTFNSFIRFEGNIQFSRNVAEGGIGGAICIDQSTLVSRNSLTFMRNVAAYRGGGLYAIDSTINITESAELTENMAVEGGGMGFEGSAKLILHSPVNLTFNHNQADSIGGSLLFIDSSAIAQCQNISIDRKSCFFGIEGANFQTSDIRMYFTGNRAGLAGTVLYGGALQTCRVEVNGTQIPVDSFELFEDISTISSEDKRGETPIISSDPLRVCFCIDDVPDCTNRTITRIDTRRGEEFTLSVITVGQGNAPVPSTIRAYIQNNDHLTELTPQSHEINATCTDITFQLLTVGSNKTLIMYPDGPCGNTDNTRRKSHVILAPCPPGFRLKQRECVCEQRLLKLNEDIQCNISTWLIQRPGNSWINPIWDENLTYLGFIYSECPNGYCRPQSEEIFFQFSPNVSDIQCSSNRSGSLCGACKEGFSLTLHSFNCKECNNSFISLLIFFGFAGFVLIAFLLALHMTVAAGTINGLILYANIVNVNGVIFFPPNHTNLLTVFISWLNLDFGFETCFYDGLDIYSYAWLDCIFPFYLWFLVGLIIYSSKFSAKVGKLLGSNPVAVLATVILLSYTKLLQGTIFALSATSLEYPDGSHRKVWLYDANIDYFKGKHAILAIVALCVIIFLLVPYIFLLLFGYRLQAYSGKQPFLWFNKFKPLLDAYYAPYRDKTRYWPGFMLVIRGLLYMVFSITVLSNPSTNLVSISSVFTAIALIPWLSFRVYEKFYNEVLEASFILNICLLSTATYHVSAVNGNQIIVTDLSIIIAFVQFVGIVAFHVYLRIKDTKLFKLIISGNCISTTKAYMKKFLSQYKKEKEKPLYQKEVSVTVVSLREALLESYELTE